MINIPEFPFRGSQNTSKLFTYISCTHKLIDAIKK